MVRTGTAGFDERYFLYVEDTDLCYRLSKLGRIRYVPEARFVHELGSSSASRWQAVALYNRGKELFFELHHGKAKASHYSPAQNSAIRPRSSGTSSPHQNLARR
jgi:GT2 family glycosyltransferase